MPLLAVACLSCSASLDDSVALQDTTGAPVIATLRLRDGALAITATERGVRYGLRGAAGRWQANLTLEELEQLNPDLHELVRAAVARSAATQPYFDARLDSRTPEHPTGSTDVTGTTPNALERR